SPVVATTPLPSVPTAMSSPAVTAPPTSSFDTPLIPIAPTSPCASGAFCRMPSAFAPADGTASSPSPLITTNRYCRSDRSVLAGTEIFLSASSYATWVSSWCLGRSGGASAVLLEVVVLIQRRVALERLRHRLLGGQVRVLRANPRRGLFEAGLGGAV